MQREKRRLARGGQMRVKERREAEGEDEVSIRRANDREGKRLKQDTEREVRGEQKERKRMEMQREKRKLVKGQLRGRGEGEMQRGRRKLVKGGQTREEEAKVKCRGGVES